MAHTAVCVPDVEAAVEWYRSVLGFTVLSPPYLVEGDKIERDMGEPETCAFLTSGIAEIVGLRTTWFADPHGLVFILMEKRDRAKPYDAQYGRSREAVTGGR
jgi:hypothetical protein